MIVSWSQGHAGQNMDESILVELGGMIARHPWWRARGRLVVELLRRQGVDRSTAILDAGCGWGTTLATLEQAGYRVTGLDISRQSLERLDRADRRLIEADLTKDLPANAHRFDVVLALDVIEHIDDDTGAVRRLAQLTRPGGLVILSVPALPELFSEFDEIQGHRRRYTHETLRDVLNGAGLLEVPRIFWWGQWMARVLSRRKSTRYAASGETSAKIYRRYLALPPWPVSYLLKAMFAFDHKRTLAGRNVRGTSLFAVAMRKNGAGNAGA